MKSGDIVEIGGHSDVQALVLAINHNRAEALVCMSSVESSNANTRINTGSEINFYPSIQGVFAKDQLNVIRSINIYDSKNLLRLITSWPALASYEKKELAENNYDFEIVLGAADLENPEDFETQLTNFELLCNRFFKSRAYPPQLNPSSLANRVLDFRSKITLNDIDSLSLGLFIRNDIARTIKDFQNLGGQESTRAYARLLLRRAIELKSVGPKSSIQTENIVSEYNSYFEFMNIEGLESLNVVRYESAKPREYLKVRRGNLTLNLETL